MLFRSVSQSRYFPHFYYFISALNYEGITASDDGNFYLLSEPGYKIVKVGEDEQGVVTESFLKEGRAVGFFKGKARGPEGMIVYNKGKKVLLVSQSDSGKMMDADIVNNKLVNIKTVKIVSKELEEVKGKEKWISDLYMYKDKIYALIKSKMR